MMSNEHNENIVVMNHENTNANNVNNERQHNQEVVPTTATIETSIAQIGFTSAITETPSFQQVLQEIPKHVNEANQLLKDYRENPDDFIENVDDTALDAQMKAMDGVFKFAQEINKSRTEIRRYFDSIRNNVIQTLDKRLSDASFHELSQAQNDIRQLRKDVIADRREKRWKEVQATFEANVARYPDLQQYAPELTDFSKFKLMNPKLISGAKTRNVREQDHTFINETIFGWSTALQIIIQNDWGLSVTHLNELLTMFKQNPSVEMVTREGQRLKEMMIAQEKARKAEEERRRKEEEERKRRDAERQAELARIQEQERIAKQQQNLQMQQQAEQQRQNLERQAKLVEQQERERQQQMMQFGSQYQTIFKESFPDFINYLFSNPRYHNVHSDSFTKVRVIYDIMQQTGNSQSVVAKETNLNPDKILELIRYIMDA